MRAEARRAAALNLRDAFVAQTGELWLRFEGQSMAPLLRDGDLLRVRCGATPAPARGAIVAFRDHEVTIVHRFLYRRRGGWLVTKGDNAWRLDRSLDPQQLIGTVCEIRRGAERIAIEGGGWPRAARRIALLSLLEGLACACAAAVYRRCIPRRLVGRIGEARLLAAVSGCRRAAVDRLLGAMDRPDSGAA